MILYKTRTESTVRMTDGRTERQNEYIHLFEIKVKKKYISCLPWYGSYSLTLFGHLSGAVKNINHYQIPFFLNIPQ